MHAGKAVAQEQLNHNLVSAIGYDTSTEPQLSSKPNARCSFLFDKRNFIDFKLPNQNCQGNVVNAMDYDSELGVMKMIIQNKLGLVLFEKVNQEVHHMDGIYRDTYGGSGLVSGRCIM